MKKIFVFFASSLLAACNWGPKTVNTKDYSIEDVKLSEPIEELRVFSQVRSKCATETLKMETALPLGAVVLGSAIKQVAAYGKDQVDIAIKYLQGDVKISGVSFLSNSSLVPLPSPAQPPKLCILAVYGRFNTDGKVSAVDTFRKIQVKNGMNEKVETFITALGEYRLSGDNSPSPLSGLVGNPVFFVEIKAEIVSGGESPEAKYIYKIAPTYLWYPHPLHKGVFDRAKRDLTVEVAFSDVKAITSLDGFPAGHMYRANDFSSRFSFVEGVKKPTLNVVSLSIIEGPDKVPSDKALAIINDAIKAKGDELASKLDEKHKPGD